MPLAGPSALLLPAILDAGLSSGSAATSEGMIRDRMNHPITPKVGLGRQVADFAVAKATLRAVKTEHR
jgi:hypothetical protein